MPELTLGVTLAVLGAALLHASWNALIKSGTDTVLDTALLAFAGTVVALPLTLVVPVPAPASWPYIAASTAAHVGYFSTMAGAYRAGDLSHGYPIMRGTAPLLIAAAGWLWLGESLPPSGWVGVLLICGGVLSLVFVKDAAGGGASRAATLWALANAVIIAIYTIADGTGVRLSGSAPGYLVWLFVFMGLPYGLLVLAMRRGELVRHAARHWLKGVGGVAMAGLAYGIALWAMTRAPMAAVAALRETSVIFAAVLGTWLLKEPFGAARLAGTLIVLSGVVALKV